MKKTRKPNELPFIPLGPFKFRLPFIHYQLEASELIQGLIIGTTALSATMYMTEILGIPYELAWGCIIIEVFLYCLHATLGDSVVPGWITAALPLVITYLTTFEMGVERTQALIALQLLVGGIFIFMGITRLADGIVKRIPNAIKGGILLSTPIMVLQGQLADDGGFMKFPIAVGVGFCVLCLISFSSAYKEAGKKFPILETIAKYGNLFPYLIAMAIGIAFQELPFPDIQIGSVIHLPDFGAIFKEVGVFAVGFPRLELFIQAIPVAGVCYVIAFGDFVISETLIKEAKESRDDEYLDFDSSRSNLVSGLRNIILGLFVPFAPLAGPLWIGLTVSITTRYQMGKEAMKSLIGGMASFRIGTLLSVILVPVVTLMQPIFPVGAALTLLFQGFVCARIGMEQCENDMDRSIAGFMAVVLAFKGAAWGLLIGAGLYLLVGYNFKKSKSA